MNLERKIGEAGLDLYLQGRLDAQSAGHLDTELEEIIRGGQDRIRLRMAGVDYISSAGIRILLKYYQMLRRLGGSFAIEQPSEVVKSAIALTGLLDLLTASAVTAAEAREATGGGAQRRFDSLACTIHPLEAGARLSCRLIGDASCFASGNFDNARSAAVRLGRDAFALGAGAFGSDFEDCRSRFGEFIAAGGATIYLPTDGSKTPDYLLVEGEFVPEVQILYAAVCEGPFAHCVRFETDAAEPGTPLSRIVQAAFDILDAPVLGLVMMAETAGLIGGTLKRSPVMRPPDEDPFAHPGVRQRIRFTPERVCDRSLVLVAGMAVRGDASMYMPFMRPLGAEPFPAGHFHAAAFNYRALPKGALDLGDTIADLFENQAPLHVLHLLNDNRPITGAGESLFTRGALWIAPIGPVRATTGRGPAA